MNYKVKRVITDIIVVIIGIAGLYYYLKNEGIYIISNLNNTELDWINKYAIYEVPFPESVIVEDLYKENDVFDIPFILHDEVIRATLLVPTDSMENMVPHSMRDYDFNGILKENDEQIQYDVFMPRTVIKWGVKTQRTSSFTVMQPGEEYTRVYIMVDKLGWNLLK